MGKQEVEPLHLEKVHLPLQSSGKGWLTGGDDIGGRHLHGVEVRHLAMANLGDGATALAAKRQNPIGLVESDHGERRVILQPVVGTLGREAGIFADHLRVSVSLTALVRICRGETGPVDGEAMELLAMGGAEVIEDVQIDELPHNYRLIASGGKRVIDQAGGGSAVPSRIWLQRQAAA